MRMASPRRALRLSRRCDLLRVPAGNDPTARVTEAAAVGCSGVYPASVEQAERAGLATVYRLMVIYLDATAEPKPDWRLAADGREYRIRAVSYWPREDSGFVELLIEEDA